MLRQVFDYNAPLLASGNASEVAISSYTMAGWQHGRKHAEVCWQCPLSPWEQNQNKWPPFRVGVTVCDGDHEERPQFTNYCSCRTQALSANMFNERKTGLHQHHVKMCKYGICIEYGRFRSIPHIKSSIPYLSHSIFHTDFSFHSIFNSIPFHTIVCPGYRFVL